MLLAIVFFNVWGVLQLVALGSLARTVRVRTVLLGMAAGLFFCTPLAAALEYAWATVIAFVVGHPVRSVIAVTGYTVDPPIEEVIRLLPLAFTLAVPAVRRQSSVTDCVLIGAALGAGFALAEDLYRFGAAPQYARAIPAGWVVPFQSPITPASSGNAFIPSIATAVGGWLPDTGGVRLFGLSAYMLPNVLLIWSSLVGLGVGLWLRLAGPGRWYAAAAPLAYASAAHVSHNADITFGRQLLVTAPFRALSDLEPLMPIAALALAWWLDRRWQADVLPEHLLAAERSAALRALGTLQAAMPGPPESIALVAQFVRLRRAFNTARLAAPHDVESLRADLAARRDYLDDVLQQPAAWTPALRAWRDRALAWLREPRTLVRLALLSPAILWFVVGGWPETAGVQRLLSRGPGWAFVVVVSLAAQAWFVWTLLKMGPAWRRVMQSAGGDLPARVILGATASFGVAGFGAFAALHAFGLWPPTAPAGPVHGSDALSSLPPEQGFPMANSGSVPMGGGAHSRSDADDRARDPRSGEREPSGGMTAQTPDGAPYSRPGRVEDGDAQPGFLQRDGNWLYDPATGQWYWDANNARWVQWAANRGLRRVLRWLLGLAGIAAGGARWGVRVINLPDDVGGRSRQPGYGSDDAHTESQGREPPE